MSATELVDIVNENNERLNLNYTNELVLPNKKTDLYNKININKTDQYNEPIPNTEFNRPIGFKNLLSKSLS